MGVYLNVMTFPSEAMIRQDKRMAVFTASSASEYIFSFLFPSILIRLQNICPPKYGHLEPKESITLHKRKREGLKFTQVINRILNCSD